MTFSFDRGSLHFSANKDASHPQRFSFQKPHSNDINFLHKSQTHFAIKHMLMLPLYWWASRRVNKSSYICIIIRMLKPSVNGWVFIHQILHAHERNERHLIKALMRLCFMIFFFFFFVDKLHLSLMIFDRLLLFASPLLTHSHSQSQWFCLAAFSAVSLSTSMLIANLPVWWFNGQPRLDLAFFSTANAFQELKTRWFHDKLKVFKPMNKLCRRLSAQLHLLNANRVQVQRQWRGAVRTHNLSRYRPHGTLIKFEYSVRT